MNEAKRSRDALRHMLEFAEEAVRHGEGKAYEAFQQDRILQLAITRLVELIGEAATRVREEDRSALPGIPWREITGMRHHLIHGYDAVDPEIVWQTLSQELPDLVAKLRPFLETD